MTSYTFDTGVISLAFAKDERVLEFLRDVERRTAEGYVSAVNLSELFYHTCRVLGRETAVIRVRQVAQALRVVETDEDLTIRAGAYKCQDTGISLPDSYALAVAARTGGLLLTTDGGLAATRFVKVRHFPLAR